MRKTICLLVLLCSLAAFAQDNVPQWKVVQAITLKNQTSDIPTTKLFTPAKDGFYRLSAYLSAKSKQEQQSAGWTFEFGYRDLTGAGGGVGLSVIVEPQNNISQLPAYVFSAKPGTPVSYTVTGYGSPQNAVYNVAFTIEELK